MDTEWRLMPVTQVIGLMETTQREPLTMCRQEGSGCSDGCVQFTISSPAGAENPSV
jgi:hypothetical protein